MCPGEAWASFPVEERAERLRAQTRCGQPDADTTSGLVAYLDGESVGWCAVEPRATYLRLRSKCRVPWEGRAKAGGALWGVRPASESLNLSDFPPSR
jgi:hypothetical protein